MEFPVVRPFRVAQILLLILVVAAMASAKTSISSRKHIRQASRVDFTALPLHFEPNLGQAPSAARFVARGRGYSIQLRPDEATLDLFSAATKEQRPDKAEGLDISGRASSHATGSQVSIHWLGADNDAAASGEQPLPSHTSYLRGDRRQWLQNVSNFEKVRFSGVYPQTDLVYYGGDQNRLEYDFVVHPGAIPQQIRFEIAGADRVSIGSNGDLRIEASGKSISFHAPLIYQESNGRREKVAGGFRKVAAREFAFRIGRYDHSRDLVIDPVLLYSTYFGTNEDDGNPVSIAADETGAIYLATSACSSGAQFQIKIPAIQSSHSGNLCDVVISKFTPSGSGLVFSTYLGGSGSDSVDASHNLKIDASHNVYVAGSTDSADFPSAGTSPPNQKNGSTFVIKLDPSGSTILNTAFLTEQAGNGFADPSNLALDGSGNLFITGQTNAISLGFSTPGGNVPGMFSSPAIDSGESWSPSATGLNTFDVRSLSVSASSPNIIYAATSSGGFSKSSNYGVTWAGGRIPGAPQTRSIAVDPTNPQVVYIGTFFNGVSKSTDGGQTWTEINNGLGLQPNNILSPPSYATGPVVNHILVDPSTPSTVYIGTNLGAYKSTDGGATWFGINNGFILTQAGWRVFQLAMDPTNHQVLYAAVNNADTGQDRGLYKSTNGGTSWSVTALNSLPTNTTSRVGNIRAVAIDPTNPNIVYAGSGQGPWKSTDAGASFTHIVNGYAVNGVNQGPFWITIDPIHPQKIYTGVQTGILKSLDAGASWFRDDNGLSSLDVRNIAVLANGNILVGTANFEAFVAEFDSGFNLINGTFSGSNRFDAPNALAVDASGNVFVAGETQGNNFGTPGAFQQFPNPIFGASGDAGFVCKLDPTVQGFGVDFCTYLSADGGEAIYGLALDSSGRIIVAGQTSSDDFPAVGAFQPTGNQNVTSKGEGFISVLDTNATFLNFSSYLATDQGDRAKDLALDPQGNYVVVGETFSPDFGASPSSLNTFSAVQPGYGGGNSDGFVMVINAGDFFIMSSSFLGGSGNDSPDAVTFDSNGNYYIAGTTDSFDFPVLPGALQVQNFGATDLFLSKFGEPAITPSPQSLNFPDQAVGTTSTPIPIVLTNTSNDWVTIRAIFSFLDFRQTNDCTNRTLEPGGQCTIQAAFRPVAPNSRHGNMFIFTDAQVAPFTIVMNGNGVSAPAVSFSSPNLDFGNRMSGTVSAWQSVKLTNTGSQTLNFSANVSGHFNENDNCSGSLAPYSSCSFAIRFAPPFPGVQSGSLDIFDNTSEGTHSVPLIGTGLNGRPFAAIGNTFVNFGNESLRVSTASFPVFIVNTGNGDLNVTSVRALGDFSQTNTCTSNPVQVLNTCTINITFRPRALGTRKGSIIITDDAPKSPQVITLTGVGVP
jgi:hypothetical protein